MALTRRAVVALLARFAEQFPGFSPTAQTVAAWSIVLERYSDDQIEQAGVVVARTHTYGPPATSHVVEAIEGKIGKVRRPITDLWNRAILREDGTPAFELEEVRQLPDGSRRQLPEAEPFRNEQIGPTGKRGRWVNPSLWIDNKPHGPEFVDFADGLSDAVVEEEE